LLVVLVLAQLDRSDTPIVNFASFFYLLALFIVPVMVFVPSLYKISVAAPMFFWGAIYFALSQVIDRGLTGSTHIEVIILEIVILEFGVWLSYRLATGIAQSESLMDVLAQGTFPHRAMELDKASEQIRTELGRSRRYHRPLSLLVVHAHPKDEEVVREMLKSVQHDVLARLSNARVGQAIGDTIRQTDLLIRDHVGRFIVLCPETELESAGFLSKRACKAVEDRTGLQVACGVASFPDEALTFEDLLNLARDRSKQMPVADKPIDAQEQIAQ
jgi:GGDEF domain-containing protein